MVPNITILNLEHIPKASHSQVTSVGLYIWNYRNLSRDSREAVVDVSMKEKIEGSRTMWMGNRRARNSW